MDGAKVNCMRSLLGQVFAFKDLVGELDHPCS